MGNRLDLIGNQYGRLLVVERKGSDEHRNAIWKCICSCQDANEVMVTTNQLRSGNTKSCGCLSKETARNLLQTHGLRYHPLYQVWRNMLARCNNPKASKYSQYGGRGIKVCDRWLSSIENFIEDVSEGYEKGLELDRINNDGDYEPDNVRWVTHQQNNMNKRSRKNTSSKYKGVSWMPKKGKWRAYITVNGKFHSLGSFLSEEDAAKAYNEAAKEMFGEYANLNIII